MAGICGLINTGDDGSDTRLDESELANGGWIESPFMFLALLGDGEVIGLSRLLMLLLLLLLLLMLLESFMLRVFKVDDRPPKVVPGKEFKGIRLIGESGDDDGDGSDSEDVSVVRVVVGDESAEFCVEVLSLCRCRVSVGIGRKCCCSCCGAWFGYCDAQVGSISMNLESTTVTSAPLSSKLSASGSNMDMNEGIWSSYSRRAAADGIFDNQVPLALLSRLRSLAVVVYSPASFFHLVPQLLSARLKIQGNRPQPTWL
jgi:hypothetical protein